MKKFNVTGMSCAACAARVESAVNRLDGVTLCSVNLLRGTLAVDGSVSDEQIAQAVIDAGYGISVADKRDNDNNCLQNKRKSTFKRLVVSACLLVILMYVSMGYVMWGAPLPAFLSENPIALAAIQLVLSVAIMVINRRFFVNGVRGVIKRAPNMDTLVSLGSFASLVYSVSVFALMILDVRGGSVDMAHHRLHDLYFESAAMILVLVSVGKMLEERAKGRTTDAIASLISLAPRTATVVRDGVEIKINADELVVGDVFIVRPGESVPCDGTVLDGSSEVDESALTGESMPKDKIAGDTVLCATVNGSGALRCRATLVGEDTAIAGVIRMVEDATATKAPIARIADKISSVFVPSVMLVSLVTFIAWMIIDANVTYALSRAISVLVISCPCALGLATPVAITVGSGVGAKLGILFKSAEAIELSGKAKFVAIDKTGTVTEGIPSVTDVAVCDGVSVTELLEIAASVEEYSEHPLGRAVKEYAVSRVTAKSVADFKALSGQGVEAILDGERVCGASFSYVSEHFDVPNKLQEEYVLRASEGKTPVVFTKGDRVLGMISLSDTIRAASAEAVAEIRALGIRTVMLTGDNQLAAKRVADEIGVDEMHAELLPAQKESVIRELSLRGSVIMIGDGINDAPALARADVGMAIGGGTDIAMESADVVLVGKNLSDAARAIRLGRAVYRNICENLFWAFAYNVIGIPLAAGVLVPFGITMSPMLAAAAMSLSSVCVVSNALRLGRFGARKTKNAKENKDKQVKNMNITVKIEGMMCPHCEARVKSAILAVPGVLSAEVSHSDGAARVEVSDKNAVAAIKSAVEAAGYPVIDIA